MEREVDLGGRRVRYELRVSARARCLRADIHLRRGLRVTLPQAMDESRVAPFLASRARWIVSTLARFERLAREIPERRLAHGERVPYLGGELALDVNVGDPKVGRLGDTLVVHVKRRVTGAVRDAWDRGEAEREIAGRARAMAARHGIEIGRVRIGDMRTLWGSCSPRGALSFNWRLMLAPPEIVEYLVLHELAHRVEHNHSSRYWVKVEEMCPAWRERERWLRKNGRSLTL
jgi:hypothetical protein